MPSPSTHRQQRIVEVLILLGLLAATAGILLMLGAFERRPTAHQITFRVEASGGYALITLRSPEENITDATTVTTPWNKSYTIASGEEVYLTAANPSQTGVLSCALLLDGEPWKREEKTAPKDGVACAGIVP